MGLTMVSQDVYGGYRLCQKMSGALSEDERMVEPWIKVVAAHRRGAVITDTGSQVLASVL
ncbi:MAG: hypothetical protein NVS2B7_28710 [Herpetosiphon sp.]